MTIIIGHHWPRDHQSSHWPRHRPRSQGQLNAANYGPVTHLTDQHDQLTDGHVTAGRAKETEKVRGERSATKPRLRSPTANSRQLRGRKHHHLSKLCFSLQQHPENISRAARTRMCEWVYLTRLTATHFTDPSSKQPATGKGIKAGPGGVTSAERK